MGWLQIKQKARDDVHKTFEHPARFRPKNGGAEIPTLARLHYQMKQFGDLDREGFATITEDLNRVLIDTRVVADAQDGDKIYFPELKRLFQLSVKIGSEDDIYNKWDVIEVTQ